MATHSSVLAWRIPGMVEPGGLPSMGSHRVGHDWSDLAASAAEPINNVVIVPGEQQSNSAVHMPPSILPPTPLPSRLPHNTEQSSLCSTVGPCHTEWSKSDREKIPYDTPYMWKLKGNATNELYLQNRNRLMDLGNEPTVTGLKDKGKG